MDRTVEHVIRRSDDLVEAFRARKTQLGISNETVEAQLLLAPGMADKYLGPSRAKKLAADLLGDLMTLLGVELVMRVNPEIDEARMRDRCVPRDEHAVRQQSRLSRRLMEIANKQLYARLSRLGNEARKAKLPGSTIQYRPCSSRYSMAAASCGCEGRCSIRGRTSMSILDPSDDWFIRQTALRLLRGESVELPFEPEKEPANVHSLAAARTNRCIKILRSRGEMK